MQLMACPAFPVALLAAASSSKPLHLSARRHTHPPREKPSKWRRRVGCFTGIAARATVWNVPGYSGRRVAVRCGGLTQFAAGAEAALKVALPRLRAGLAVVLRACLAALQARGARARAALLVQVVERAQEVALIANAPVGALIVEHALQRRALPSRAQADLCVVHCQARVQIHVSCRLQHAERTAERGRRACEQHTSAEQHPHRGEAALSHCPAGRGSG